MMGGEHTCFGLFVVVVVVVVVIFLAPGVVFSWLDGGDRRGGLGCARDGAVVFVIDTALFVGCFIVLEPAHRQSNS